ncbi:14716_t:CDS:2 [Cetraspora pellucida]|uniref:14716_t:CDS:1 n=1 Tax=Cetraspora pellucida TaxID=1433469 RepID=A0A9N9CEB8_9GLOM|nr:14716_t:CDS:2 [Cetraspora pellucida]
MPLQVMALFVNMSTTESMATLLGFKSFVLTIADYYVTVFIDNRVARKMVELGEERPWQKEIMQKVETFFDRLNDKLLLKKAQSFQQSVSLPRYGSSMQCKATIILITPVWPLAPWWPILLQQKTEVIELSSVTKSFILS